MEFGWINLFGAVIVVLIMIPNIMYALALYVIPIMIFLLSGTLLHHWLLVAVAALFGFAHCRITYMTHAES